MPDPSADEADGGDGQDHGHDYRAVAVDEVENTPNPTRIKRELDEAVGAGGFGCNYYEADPGEQVPWGYHRHPDHEELFYVIAGELDVETADGTVRVGADEAFFAPEGAPTKAVAAGDDPARLLAVGAPKTDDGATVAEQCPACGEVTDRDHREEEGRDGAAVYVLTCAACGAETRRFSNRIETADD